MTTENTVAAAEIADSNDCLLVDVRTPGEYAESHLESSVNVPLGDLSRFESELVQLAGDRELVLICRTGQRAEMARETLAKSCERQVRIAAGLFVLTGVLLGTFVHAGLYAIAGMVGAGLVFAGITDT